MITSTDLALGHFEGVLDEARVWDHARTGDQIAADLNKMLPAGSDLVARWGFEEGSGAILDSIAPGADGTLMGSGANQLASGAPFDILPGLVGWWQMEGDLTDSAPPANSAAGVDSPSYDTGKIGQALALDGTSQTAALRTTHPSISRTPSRSPPGSSPMRQARNTSSRKP